ncbi:MAG: methyltransferase [Clostridia bacterium]|nr:methyltransferase [Clostridia bacterium]
MEYLNDEGLLIEQPSHLYKLSSDAVALGNFVECKTNDTIIDVGCGTGVLTLLIADRHHPREIIAVDINADAVEQLNKNLALNQNRLSATSFITLHADARQLHKIINHNADVIVCNPPYFNTGKKSQNEHVNQARHDDTLSLEDLATLCTRNLKYGGNVYFCYPSNQIAKAIAIFENHNFRIKTIKLIANQKGVYLAIFRAKKGGGHQTTILA